MRIILIGSAKIGKSKILQRYITNEFNSNYIATIGNIFIKYWGFKKALNLLVKTF